MCSAKPEQPRQDKNLMYPPEEPMKPIKEGLLSDVLLESPFASVSTVGRDHPSLVFLFVTQCVDPYSEQGGKGDGGGGVRGGEGRGRGGDSS